MMKKQRDEENPSYSAETGLKVKYEADVTVTNGVYSSKRK